MSDMKHAIKKAARVIDSILGADPQVARELYGYEASYIARALAEAGLLAPAPLREEWAVEGSLDSGDDWIADCEFATRLGAEDFLDSNEWARRDGGHVSHRYYTDWLPTEGDGRADQ